MASSYYRRTSGHERDTILRQGTKADLTSGQIYGRTSGLSILARKADRLRKTDTTVADNDNDDREMIKEDRCRSLRSMSFHRTRPPFNARPLILFLVHAIFMVYIARAVSHTIFINIIFYSFFREK